MRWKRAKRPERSEVQTPRVFIGLLDIASYYSGLKQGFDELGIESAFFPLVENRFARKVDTNPASWVLWLVGKILRGERSNHGKARSYAHHRVLIPTAKLLLLIWATLRYDVFVFGSASTFFDYRELPLLKFLGKRIIYVFNGSDSRPPYINGSFAHPGVSLNPVECSALARRIKERVVRIERYADICVNHPPQAHFHEKKFVNHCFIGHPCQLTKDESEVAIRSVESAGPLRIVHAPTNPGPKGTALVRELMETFVAEGLPIRYIELVDRPNCEVLRELRNCDIVLDELYSDIPLAGLGTEAACFGKPVLVGGYAQEELGRLARGADLPMQLYVKPEAIEFTLRQLISDAPLRQNAGSAAKSFVASSWTPKMVAFRFLRLCTGDVPSEWWVDPNEIAYLLGWGLAKPEAKAYLTEYLRLGGIDALQLSDKPTLAAKFQDFVESSL